MKEYKKIKYYAIKKYIYQYGGIAGYETITFVDSLNLAKAICENNKNYYYEECTATITV